MSEAPEKSEDVPEKSVMDSVKQIIAYLRQPQEYARMKKGGVQYKEEDLAYMQSLSAAVIEHRQQYSLWVLAVIVFTFLAAVLWMGWAKLDTIVRAEGKVIPSSYVQKIQSLEGGLLSEILVKEGDVVEINQPLIKISDIPFLSSYEESSIKYYELKARAVRLKAEANLTPFGTDLEVVEVMPELLESEKKLYENNKNELEQNLKILSEQVKQARSQLLETKSRRKQLSKTVQLLRREVKIKKPLVERKVLNEVEFLQLQGREAEAEGELDSLNLSIPRIQSLLDESESKLKQSKLEFLSRSRKELNEISAEISRISESQTNLADRVERTTLRSPVTGTVKRIFIKSVGGVIKPGSDIVEVVPSDDTLLVEAHIKPADIGNVEVGQLTRLKFTAYDFAIYGSIQGKVRFISADTITNEEGESYYLARVEPHRHFLGVEADKKFIKVGMASEVDIITGKKTILSYLLKPINRAMDSALRER